MKLTIEQSNGTDEVEIVVRCGLIDERLSALLAQIRLYAFSLTGVKDGQHYVVSMEEVQYIESVDETTFLYRADDVLTCAHKLYELESVLAGGRFQRISKSTILNLAALESVAPQFDGRFEARLKSGEILIVSRHYAKAFKQKFGL